MVAQELRIGNYITYLGNVKRVKGVCKDSEKENLYYITAYGCNVSTNHSFKPIELTEEILLKCGFKKLGKYTFVCITSLMQLELCVISNKILHSILAIEVKHLHQLQNLYFALTNEELEINL